MMERGMNQDLFFIQTLRIPMSSVAKPGSNYVAHQYENVYVCILYALGK